MKVDILKGHVSTAPLHRRLSIPPPLTISRLVQQLKGKSSFKALRHFPELKKVFWGRHVWERGYFVHSSGKVTDEVINMDLENQKHDDDDFQLED
jgi:putative transposase